MVKVQFLPAKKTVEVPRGSTILQAAIKAEVEVESTCGGKGTCGKCKVKIWETKQKPVAPDSTQSTKRWVLACQHSLFADTIVELTEPKEVDGRKLSLNIIDRQLTLAPSIEKNIITVKEPSLNDPFSDWERLLSALPAKDICFNRRIAATLPEILRRQNYKATTVLDGKQLLAVEPGDTRKRCFGLAIDIGTTTIVVHLLNLTTGEAVASGAATNPQKVFGADVISRITYVANNPLALSEMQNKVIGGLNNIIVKLCEDAKVLPEEIYQGVVVGNTTMSHLFLGVDPTYLAPTPFVPAFRQMVEVEAAELGLNMLGTGKVIVLPNVAGYVGSDTVGVMLAAEVERLQGINLLIDIGTNGEIILTGRNKILTCSTAAGPAFEGAEIKYGMRASQGAIEGVNIANDVELEIIIEEKARGICGSGLIDAVAEMLRVGIIDPTGRLVGKEDDLKRLPPLVRNRLRQNNGGREFVLVWREDSAIGEDIVLTQKDIRELQLAKGAIVAGTRLLLKEMGVEYRKLERVMLAGAFGNYIKKESARRIGLIPQISSEKISGIGNAACEGAKLALLSLQERERAVTLATRAEHIELSTREEFQEEFLKALSFDNVT